MRAQISIILVVAVIAMCVEASDSCKKVALKLLENFCFQAASIANSPLGGDTTAQCNASQKQAC